MKYNQLTKKLNYEFKNAELLERALTHRSKSKLNNERLEFLGDSLVNTIITLWLFQHYDKASEGELSRRRAKLINKDTLARLGKQFGLGEYVQLGPSEAKTGAYQRRSVIADTMEAIIGAIYLDSDIHTIQQIVLGWFAPLFKDEELMKADKDPKTALQEYTQARSLPLPTYEILSIEGAPHDQAFMVKCSVEGMDHHTTGLGRSRRLAERDAAGKFLNKLYSQ